MSPNTKKSMPLKYKKPIFCMLLEKSVPVIPAIMPKAEYVTQIPITYEIVSNLDDF